MLDYPDHLVGTVINPPIHCISSVLPENPNTEGNPMCSSHWCEWSLASRSSTLQIADSSVESLPAVAHYQISIWLPEWADTSLVRQPHQPPVGLGGMHALGTPPNGSDFTELSNTSVSTFSPTMMVLFWFVCIHLHQFFAQ